MDPATLGEPEAVLCIWEGGVLETTDNLGVLWERQGLGKMSAEGRMGWGRGGPKSETRCGQGDGERRREARDSPPRKVADIAGERRTVTLIPGVLPEESGPRPFKASLPQLKAMDSGQ